MANEFIGKVGENNTGALELHDHNGKLEVIPCGAFDYAMLSPEQVAELMALCSKFLATREKE